MKKVITLLLVSFYALLAMPMNGFSQKIKISENFDTKDPKEVPFMYVASDVPTTQPEWVSYMYKKPTDVKGITAKYEKFYKNNEFIKNQHTQYYKRLLRGHSRISYDYTDPVNKIRESQNSYLKNRSSKALKTSSEWSSVGPTDLDLNAVISGNTPGTAHVSSLNFCAGQEQHILAGTATAGLWKTDNNGENWELITHDLPITSVLAAGFMPMNPSVIYLAGVDVFYKSTDAGISWTITGGAALDNANYTTTEIMIDPDNPDLVYLSTKKGLFKSTDAGENFTKILTGFINDIELHPENNNILYALKVVSNKTEFYRSTDGGENFTNYTDGYPIPGIYEEQKRTVLAVSPNEPDAVFALAVGKMNNGDGLVGIYKSTNQGTCWERRCCGDTDGGPASTSNPNIMEWGCSGTANGGQYYYDLALGVNPMDSDEILTGGINLWKSNDGGLTVNCHSNYIYKESPETYVHADIHDIKYINGTIWIASDGGIFRSTDGANSFEKRMNGIHGTDFRGFDVAFYDENIMLGGTYHNGTMLKEGNTYLNDWVSTRSGDTKRAFINKQENSIIYDDSGKRLLTGDRMDAPKNITLSRKPNSSYTIGESSEIVFDPFNSKRFYLGQSGVLYRTNNNGVTFEQVYNFGTGKVTSIEVSSNLPGLLYVVYYPSYGAAKKIMRSTNDGQSWLEVTVPSSLYNNEDTWVAWDIAISSNSPLQIWAVRTPQVVNGVNLDGNMLFYSSNGGNSWINITPSLLDGEYPTNIIHQKGTDDVIYLGTRRSVYYQKEDQPLQLISNGLPAYTFSTKLVAHYKSGKLFNATHRGLYEMDLIDEGMLAVPMVDKQYSTCLRDTFSFKDHSPVINNSTRLWTFTGANTETSSEISPKITYSQPGIYPVKLEVFSENLSAIYESMTFIEVEDGCAIDTVVGNALKITSNSYAKIPPFENTFEEMTITAWVKRNGIIYNDAGVTLHREGPNGHGLVINTDGYLSALWDDISTSFVSDLYVPYNKWAHVAMTVKPEGISLYVNGIEQFQSRSITPKQFNDFFYIGGDEFNPSAVLNGFIDEICFYDKALSSDEIRLYMNLVHKTPPESLISYYQANNSTGEMTDRVGLSHAYLINNVERQPSNAQVGSGCADLVEIYGPGTYTFECAGVEMTFNEGDITPNGAISAVKIYDLPNIPLPPEDQLSESYWVINNFGANQSFTAPSDFKVSGFGYVADDYLDDPEFFSLYMVPNFWEYGWGAEIDQPDSLSSVENTKVIFDEVDNMSYFGKIVLGGIVSPALSAWDITLDAELINNSIELTWTGVSNDMEYELLKSDNGENFYSIQTGKGTLDFNSKQNYKDSRLNSSILYYKLKVNDSTNKTWESKIISVKIPALENFDFYPNVIQSGDPINIVIGEDMDVKWELYDMKGQLIKEAIQNQPMAMYNISANTGQYVLKMSQSSFSKSKILVIQ